MTEDILTVVSNKETLSLLIMLDNNLLISTVIEKDINIEISWLTVLTDYIE